jgi:hypothetical protein
MLFSSLQSEEMQPAIDYLSNICFAGGTYSQYLKVLQLERPKVIPWLAYTRKTGTVCDISHLYERLIP